MRWTSTWNSLRWSSRRSSSRSPVRGAAPRPAALQQPDSGGCPHLDRRLSAALRRPGQASRQSGRRSWSRGAR
eukprot:scaffold3005_cov302-Prasinococcus_capsulatus_cf.AAC.4